MAIVEIHGYARNSTRDSRALLNGTFRLDGYARSKTDASALPLGFRNEDFVKPMQGLLPRGPIWNREDGSNTTKLIRALSYSLTMILRRGLDLIEEADPRTTVELLPDWERVLGLPDCSITASTVDERRDAVVAKMNGFDSPTDAVLTAIALVLGYTIEIVTYAPMTPLSSAGDSLRQHPWQFAWTATTPHGTNDALLECVLAQSAPRHTSLLFYYWYDLWRLRSPDASSTANWLGLAYDTANDLWCVAGTGGEIQTSPDGFDWAEQTPAAAYTGSFQGAVHNGIGTWCIAGASGEIQTSPDGITWTHRVADAAFSGIFWAVSFVDTISDFFVAVGDGGEIQTSTPTGSTWTARTADSSYTGDFRGAASQGLLTVIVGETAEIQTSLGPSSWTHQTSATGFTGTFYAVATNGAGLWVVVGASGEIQTSDDSGVTWVRRDNANGFTGSFYGVGFGDSVFCVVGTTGEIQLSSDGINWYEDSASFSATLYNAVHDGDRLMCSGSSGGAIQTATRVEPDAAY